MTGSLKDKIRVQVLWIFRQIYRRRGLWLRGLLAWIIALTILEGDEKNSFDRRFQLRGQKKVSPQIILIELKQEDFNRYPDFRAGSYFSFHEINDLTDSFFWDKTIWRNLLQVLLSAEPKAIGVSLFFGANIGGINLSTEEEHIFKDPKIFWSTSFNHMDQLVLPSFANKGRSNLGRSELIKDDDGVVRRIFPKSAEAQHLVEKISGRSFPESENSISINYLGLHQFPKYSLREILSQDNLSIQQLRNKIILIGAEFGTANEVLTPYGASSRLEVLAQLTDNLVEWRWVHRFPYFIYAVGIFLIMILAVFIITHYPQNVALVLLVWVATLIAALSAWVFDSLYIWLPVYTPLMLLSITWVIFVGYQATKIENQNFQLQQEQKYLHELEQLKNNFISLISHDLKTPIAKIQSIVSRMQRINPNAQPNDDLSLLKVCSEELYRYIQSILNLLRVESRDFKLITEVADINQTIQEACEQLRPLAIEKNIEIEQDLEPLFSLEFDPTLIREVLLNIIENAIKYSPANKKIYIQSRELDDEIQVIVKDQGPGISKEEMDLVWQKFTRGKDQELKTKGTGLGLYLVKYFIELHGGKVGLESLPGLGTSLSFTLPLSSGRN